MNDEIIVRKLLEGCYMTEIKFRAWDKKTKKIREIDSIAFHNKNSIFDFDNSNLPKVFNLWGYDTIEQKNYIIHREQNEVEPMRFIGRKDKNGKDIYEGDIIKGTLFEYHKDFYDDELPIMGEVIYDSESSAFSSKNESGYTFLFNINNIEIIGNIHQNKELLNKLAL